MWKKSKCYFQLCYTSIFQHNIQFMSLFQHRTSQQFQKKFFPKLIVLNSPNWLLVAGFVIKSANISWVGQYFCLNRLLFGSDRMKWYPTSMCFDLWLFSGLFARAIAPWLSSKITGKWSWSWWLMPMPLQLQEQCIRLHRLTVPPLAVSLISKKSEGLPLSNWNSSLMCCAYPQHLMPNQSRYTLWALGLFHTVCSTTHMLLFPSYTLIHVAVLSNDTERFWRELR